MFLLVKGLNISNFMNLFKTSNKCPDNVEQKWTMVLCCSQNIHPWADFWTVLHVHICRIRHPEPHTTLLFCCWLEMELDRAQWVGTAQAGVPVWGTWQLTQRRQQQAWKMTSFCLLTTAKAHLLVSLQGFLPNVIVTRSHWETTFIKVFQDN